MDMKQISGLHDYLGVKINMCLIDYAMWTEDQQPAQVKLSKKILKTQSGHFKCSFLLKSNNKIWVSFTIA